MKSILLSITFIWVASFHVQSQEKWTCYTDDDALLMDDHRVLGMFDYVDGSFWILTNKGINIFNNGSWKIINKKTELLRNKIGAYLLDSQDRVWVGTGTPGIFFESYGAGQLYEGGVVIYDGKDWKPMSTKEMGFKAPKVTQIFEATNGDIWFGLSTVTVTGERGNVFAKGRLLRLAKETGEWSVYGGDDVPCIDCQFVRGFYENENGRLYFIADAGIYYFENDSFHRVKKTEEYSFYWPVNSRFKDSNKNLWLGAPARVYHYNGQKWRSFNRKNGLPSTDNPPYGFTETLDNGIIMTAKNGLYYYDNENLWVKEKMKLLTSNSYVDKQDRHWIPALKGLIVRDGENETLHKDIPWVWRVIEDNNGGIWALTKNKGVKRLKDGEWELFNKDNQLPSDKVVMFYTSKNGTVWLGTNKGICSCEYE
ncbi:MAG: hypothetical protein KJO90_01200 [Eudoraea sp.]|nr:hypothetical protein [Eudoraea sp.]